MGPHMTSAVNVSSVDASNGSVSVEVTCDEGYILESGETTQSAQCVAAGENAYWNSSLTECLRK